MPWGAAALPACDGSHGDPASRSVPVALMATRTARDPDGDQPGTNVFGVIDRRPGGR